MVKRYNRISTARNSANQVSPQLGDKSKDLIEKDLLCYMLKI